MKAVRLLYYFPGDASKKLYPEIPLVNTFRLVFDQYFGADLPLLPDQLFTSTYTRPYDFKPVKVPGESK